MAVSTIRQVHLSHQPGSGAAWAALWLVLSLMLGFAIQQGDFAGAAAWMNASGEQVFARREYWRALTAIFAHGDLGHLAANAVFTGGLAYLLYGYFGRWAFPFLAIIGGVITNFVSLWTYDPHVTMVGASGMTYWMGAFWLALYLGIERRLSVPRRLMNAAALTLGLLAPSAFEPKVSYRTHAIGYLLGWAMGLVYFQIQKRKLRASEVYQEVIEEPEFENFDEFGSFDDQLNPRNTEESHTLVRLPEQDKRLCS